VLARLLILAALAPAALAAPVVEQEAIPGLPAVKVQDLHYGDVLFYFYQQDHFDALVRLAAYRDQDRLAEHARDADLLRGGLYLSLGQHREAREIFERLLSDAATPQDVRNQAWFWLGKVLYAAGLYEDSDHALRQAAGTLPEDMEAERHLLIAQGLLYRQRYEQAIAELSGWQGPRYWLAYGQFNLGVALVRAGEAERGLALLDAVGQL
jgi:tetratricopeptide (TPR) repeat protein